MVEAELLLLTLVQAALARHVRVQGSIREASGARAPLGGRRAEGGELAAEAAALRLADRLVVGGDREVGRIGDVGDLPGTAHGADAIAASGAAQPVVPDGRAVDLQPPDGGAIGDRCARARGEGVDVTDVVVDVGVDEVLGPRGGRLEQPDVLEAVVVLLEEVVELVREGHPRRLEWVGIAVLVGRIVVVDHHVAVLASRPALARVGRLVAEQALGPELLQIDVGVRGGVRSAALGVGLRRGPSEVPGSDLDRVGELRDLQDRLDVVGGAVPVAVREIGGVRVGGVVDPVNAEVRALGGGNRRVRRIAVPKLIGGSVGRARQEAARAPSLGALELGQRGREHVHGHRRVGSRCGLPARLERRCGGRHGVAGRLRARRRHLLSGHRRGHGQASRERCGRRHHPLPDWTRQQGSDSLPEHTFSR